MRSRYAKSDIKFSSKLFFINLQVSFIVKLVDYEHKLSDSLYIFTFLFAPAVYVVFYSLTELKNK